MFSRCLTYTLLCIVPVAPLYAMNFPTPSHLLLLTNGAFTCSLCKYATTQEDRLTPMGCAHPVHTRCALKNAQQFCTALLENKDPETDATIMLLIACSRCRRWGPMTMPGMFTDVHETDCRDLFLGGTPCVKCKRSINFLDNAYFQECHHVIHMSCLSKYIFQDLLLLVLKRPGRIRHCRIDFVCPCKKCYKPTPLTTLLIKKRPKSPKKKRPASPQALDKKTD